MNMKKLVIALMMVVAGVGNAQAFEFKINESAVAAMIVQSIIKQQVPSTVHESDIFDIHTDTMITTGKSTECWNKVVYDSKGNARTKVVCY